ncbi:EAL domain-containing protein [uncultured Nisaea sp.]|uniref:putative bifunctional diguanylate cyclase/phosphodiesterase n=1 Tax=uncultured Nisaea sp. TaxID=538215 RepID=UPI0030ED8FE7|tara:strand:+ start:817 stop:2508 length:1692 start_codon:yes stop_codon:yes gene_type:complete
MSDIDIADQFSSFDALHDSVFLIDFGGLVIAANTSALDTLGLTAMQLVGSPFSNYFPDCDMLVPGGDGDVIEISGRRGDGARLLLEGRSSVVYRNGSRCCLLVMRDRHSRVSLEEKLIWAAFNDPVTKLPNLVGFCSRIGQRIHVGEFPLDGTAMVIAISLGRLGFFAGTLGEATRARIVREAGDRLGRLEEVIEIALLDDSTLGVVVSTEDGPDDLTGLVEKLRICVEVSYSPSENAARIVPHFGISRISDPDLDPEDIVRKARFALNAAMQKAMGSAEIYEDETHREAVRHLVVEHDLRRAIFERKEEFWLAYQPKVDCNTGAISGLEALIRWNHPKRGLVGPNEFLPIARQAGIASDLTFIVLERLVEQIKEWQLAGLNMVPIAFNIGAEDVRENRLVPFLANLLQDAGIAPSALECELTETSIVADMRAAKHLFDQLVEMGLQTAVDDFGTGYSSLVHIIDLPVKVVKIDKSFVQTMETSKGSNAIVQAIVAMTRAMGAICVAEGVETPKQFADIRKHGCDLAQGYLFDKPLTPEAAAARLRETRSYGKRIDEDMAILV